MEQLRRFILSFLSLLSVTFMYAQSGEISGNVVDGTGEPIIGATVMEKGTSNGTITDILHIHWFSESGTACPRRYEGCDAGRCPVAERGCRNWLHHPA